MTGLGLAGCVFLGLLQDKCGEPAAIIMSMLGERYGAVKRRRTKPPRDGVFRKALDVMLEDTGSED